MKYYKSSRFPKFIGSVGFIALLACALIAIGVAIWVAVANRNEDINTPINDGSSNAAPSDDNQTPSYNEPTPSYNSSTDNMPEASDMTPSTVTDVAGNTSSVPYEEETTEDAPPEVQSFILPVDGSIIKDFNDTALQYSKTYGDMRLHTGIDITCDIGSNIKAMGSGTVTAVEEVVALGKTVTVDHGGITVKYCGFDSISVFAGDPLNEGDILGTAGTVPSECADQSHIHIEVIKDGKHISPLKALGFE